MDGRPSTSANLMQHWMIDGKWRGSLHVSALGEQWQLQPLAILEHLFSLIRRMQRNCSASKYCSASCLPLASNTSPNTLTTTTHTIAPRPETTWSYTPRAFKLALWISATSRYMTASTIGSVASTIGGLPVLSAPYGAPAAAACRSFEVQLMFHLQRRDEDVRKHPRS